MSSMNWIRLQLAAKFTEPTSQPRFNPRPPGVIRPGSATQVTLVFLQEHNGRFWSCFELCKYTGRSIKAVNHACMYLKAQELIETCPDPRNPQYLRYGIKASKE